jgi:hypothetical protein
MGLCNNLHTVVFLAASRCGPRCPGRPPSQRPISALERAPFILISRQSTKVRGGLRDSVPGRLRPPSRSENLTAGKADGSPGRWHYTRRGLGPRIDLRSSGTVAVIFPPARAYSQASLQGRALLTSLGIR